MSYHPLSSFTFVFYPPFIKGHNIRLLFVLQFNMQKPTSSYTCKIKTYHEVRLKCLFFHFHSTWNIHIPSHIIVSFPKAFWRKLWYFHMFFFCHNTLFSGIQWFDCKDSCTKNKLTYKKKKKEFKDSIFLFRMCWKIEVSPASTILQSVLVWISIDGVF